MQLIRILQYAVFYTLDTYTHTKCGDWCTQRKKKSRSQLITTHISYHGYEFNEGEDKYHKINSQWNQCNDIIYQRKDMSLMIRFCWTSVWVRFVCMSPGHPKPEAQLWTAETAQWVTAGHSIPAGTGPSSQPEGVNTHRDMSSKEFTVWSIQTYTTSSHDRKKEVS